MVSVVVDVFSVVIVVAVFTVVAVVNVVGVVSVVGVAVVGVDGVDGFDVAVDVGGVGVGVRTSKMAGGVVTLRMICLLSCQPLDQH